MSDNKNLTPEELQTPPENERKRKIAFIKKESRQKKLKNTALFKRGGYSLIVTAAFLAVVIILNVLVSVISDRFVLEFDMSSEKDSSFSQENVDYIKKVEDEISIIVCANKEDYTGGYMQSFAQSYYAVYDSSAPYYDQTVKLIELYEAYNKNIDVQFMDTQSSEFAAVAQKYATETIGYGDVIVSATVNGNERHKILAYDDIYNIEADENSTYYGTTIYTVQSNNVENAVTGAIAYVTASETKTVGVITGHSTVDYSASYIKLLEDNNYEIEKLEAAVLMEIPEEVDAIAIVAPNIDFTADELEIISDFLDNGGKLDKGLLFFGSVKAPYLTNLYDFLAQWGIGIEEGVLYETNAENHMTKNQLALGLYALNESDVTKGMRGCISGNNIPMKVIAENDNFMTVTALMSTPDSVIAAPVGTTANWNGTANYETDSYDGVIEAVKTDYDDEGLKEYKNYVYAFGSTDYFDSDYAEWQTTSNKLLVLSTTEKATLAEKSEVQFVSKVIYAQSYQNQITEASTDRVFTVFAVIIPILCVVAGIYIYIKRRNA